MIFAYRCNFISFLLLSILLSGWISFSLPQRLSPGTEGGMDSIAVAKLGIRCGIILAWASYLVLQVKKLSTGKIDQNETAVSLDCLRFMGILWPWLAFIGWAVFSVLWSPLKSVTIGQSLGLASQIVLTWAVACLCPAAPQRHTVLKCLFHMLWIFSAAVMACHWIAPDSSGLLRNYTQGGSIGIVHPTAAGANASLGLIVTTWMLIQYRQKVATHFVILAIHVVVLFMSQSRTALAMGVIVVVPYVLWKMTLHKIGLALCCTSLLFTFLLLIDPEFRSIEFGLRSAGTIAARGQSLSEIRAVSGRAEMWNAVWKEFEKSKAIGHGYFVTSAAGKLDVWHVPNNYTAHNVYLQALVSTGVVGAVLFGLGFLQLARKVPWSKIGSLGSLAGLLFVWFAGWTLTCESMLGPVRTESVLFFVFVGLLLSHASSAGAVT